MPDSVNPQVSLQKDKGTEPEIVVEIKTRSKEGFDRTALDSKVKETLRQLGVNIEDWKKE